MAWERHINTDHIRFVNQNHLDGARPDWVPTDHASVNLTAVYAVEVREDPRGPFAYVFYTSSSDETKMPDLTLQLAPAERLIRALRLRANGTRAAPTC